MRKKFTKNGGNVLTAVEARALSDDEFVQIMYMIEDRAKCGYTYIKLDYKVEPYVLEYLKELGYNIDIKNSSIYEETPYGPSDMVLTDNIVITISW